MILMGQHDRRRLLVEADDVCRRLHAEGCHVALVVLHPASGEATVIDRPLGPATERHAAEIEILTALSIRFLGKPLALPPLPPPETTT